MGKRNTGPTMKTTQIGANKSDDPLQQQFTVLQQQWDTFKQSNPGRRSTNTINVNNLKLFKNSPRALMSFLQHRIRSPSEGCVWKLRNDEMAAEIIRDRWEAIESGKLKGRRLFGDLEGATEMGFEGREDMFSDGSDLVQESEVRSSVCSFGAGEDEVINGGCGSKGDEVGPVCRHCCSCSGSSSRSGEMVEREKVGVEREKIDGVSGGINGGRLIFGMGWFAIVLMLFTLGIISMRCNGGFVDGEEVTLVPT